AFQATLEEVVDATMLVHVVDISNPFWPRQRDAVEALLLQLGAGGKPTVLVWNKTDLGAQQPPDDGVAVSAKTGTGLSDLRARIQQTLLLNAAEARS
ncbi:MAG: GTPase HflX, partial [Candidatus Eremiobacteraeota bacterium]|nr:GTPase HflX [Candidatus Eremiobacteraeota bacterium]